MSQLRDESLVTTQVFEFQRKIQKMSFFFSFEDTSYVVVLCKILARKTQREILKMHLVYIFSFEY